MHQDLIEASLPEGPTGQQEAPVAPPHSQQIPHHAGVTIPPATTAAAVTAATTAAPTEPAPATASPSSMSTPGMRARLFVCLLTSYFTLSDSLYSPPSLPPSLSPSILALTSYTIVLTNAGPSAHSLHVIQQPELLVCRPGAERPRPLPVGGPEADKLRGNGPCAPRPAWPRPGSPPRARPSHWAGSFIPLPPRSC